MEKQISPSALNDELAQVVGLLQQKGLLLKKGTIVDSTRIEALSSTKNRKKQRDPDAHQAKKGSQWHFGYKSHIGVDKDSGLAHSVKVAAAPVSDVATTPHLLTGEEEVVLEDSGYLGAVKREDAVVQNNQGEKIWYKINCRPSQIKNRSLWSQGQIKRREREKSSIRAKDEHVFAVVKGMFRHPKDAVSGLQKQVAAMNMLFTLANLILADRPSLAA